VLKWVANVFSVLEGILKASNVFVIDANQCSTIVAEDATGKFEVKAFALK
jgi:hypothetical protein